MIELCKLWRANFLLDDIKCLDGRSESYIGIDNRKVRLKTNEFFFISTIYIVPVNEDKQERKNYINK